MASRGEVVSSPTLGDRFATQSNERPRGRVPGPVVVSAPVVCAWLVSVVMRWGDWRSGYPNMEATYHSLLMLRALQADSFSDHLGLPTVTLGGADDHWIPWAATVPTSSGAYIYTSFGSIGWLIPSILLRIMGVTPSLGALFGLGVILGLACALGLALLAWAIVRTRAYEDSTVRRLLVGTVVGVGYLFAPEVLLSQGALLWVHALTQLFLVGACAGFYLALSRSDRRRGVLLLFVSMTLYSAAEWSGCVAGAGFAAVAGVAWWRWRDKNLLCVAGTSAAGAVVGAVGMAVHFAAGVGVGPLMVAWRARFLYRSGVQSRPFTESLLVWQAGLLVSLGLLLPVVLALAVVLRKRSGWGLRPSRMPRVAVLTVMAGCTPLAENLLLLEHAAEFSFDRLKWLVPMVLLLGLLADAFRERLAVVPVVAVLMCAVVGLAVYQGRLQTTSERWNAAAGRNAAAAAWTEDVLGGDTRCATFSSSGDVRGYVDVVFNRSVYEAVPDFTAARALTRKRSGCATVFVTTVPVLTDMPAITRVRVERGGRTANWAG